jgi:hypothetical protein
VNKGSSVTSLQLLLYCTACKRKAAHLQGIQGIQGFVQFRWKRKGSPLFLHRRLTLLRLLAVWGPVAHPQLGQLERSLVEARKKERVHWLPPGHGDCCSLAGQQGAIQVEYWIRYRSKHGHPDSSGWVSRVAFVWGLVGSCLVTLKLSEASWLSLILGP